MTPIVIRRERMLTLPVDVLWQLLEPADTLPAWLPFISRSRHLTGKGLGRRQRATLHWGGRPVDVEQEVTIYEPTRRLAWRQLPGDRTPAAAVDDITLTLAMESMGPGTRVVLEARLVPRSLASALRLRLRTARRIRRGFDRAFKTLAAVGG